MNFKSLKAAIKGTGNNSDDSQMKGKTMKEFLETVARELVDLPDEVEVTEVQGDGVNILKLKVAKTEIGLVIGKHGRTAEAIRVLLNAVGAKAGKKLVLEILE